MRGTRGLPSERYGRIAPLPPIVVVEDDPVTLAGWTELLGAAGYPVVAATTFQAGRDAIDAGSRLLIVDVRLGSYNGLQLVMRAQSQQPRLPSIVVTGFADEVIIGEAHRLGAMCLEKPVNPERLLALVASSIDEAYLDAHPRHWPASGHQHGAALSAADLHDAPDAPPLPVDCDVLIVREPAGVSRPDDLITHPTRSQFRVSVQGQYGHGVRLFDHYSEATTYGEGLAADRRVRLFYVDRGASILLKDNRPAGR